MTDTTTETTTTDSIDPAEWRASLPSEHRLIGHVLANLAPTLEARGVLYARTVSDGLGVQTSTAQALIRAIDACGYVEASKDGNAVYGLRHGD